MAAGFDFFGLKVYLGGCFATADSADIPSADGLPARFKSIKI